MSQPPSFEELTSYKVLTKVTDRVLQGLEDESYDPRNPESVKEYRQRILSWMIGATSELAKGELASCKMVEKLMMDVEKKMLTYDRRLKEKEDEIEQLKKSSNSNGNSSGGSEINLERFKELESMEKAQLCKLCKTRMMQTPIAEKAKNGRCVGFPGYCKENQDSCPKFHPVVQCTRYPECPKHGVNNTRFGCTFMHPICELDCAKMVCKEKACQKYHPYRDSYFEKNRRYPENLPSSEDNLAVIQDPPDFDQDRFCDSLGPFQRMTQRVLSPKEVVEQDYLIREEVRNVSRNIEEFGQMERIYKSRYVNTDRCLSCRGRASSQLLPCGHLTFCLRCVKTNVRCPLCGSGYEWETARSLL